MTESNVATAKAAMESVHQFTGHYYKMIQHSRHNIEKLYHDSASLLYAGNLYKTKAQIVKLIQNTPPCSHTVDTVDCQEVGLKYTNGKKTILVVVTGTVKYESEKKLKGFHQTFTIVNMDQKWKIMSETIRLHSL